MGVIAVESQQPVETLREKHANIQQMLDDEARRPMPDQGTISQLKREKLKIKDRIAELEEV
ncbi:MAG: YdcH family protein [Alphaproteobacteria bacterium]